MIRAGRRWCSSSKAASDDCGPNHLPSLLFQQVAQLQRLCFGIFDNQNLGNRFHQTAFFLDSVRSRIRGAIAGSGNDSETPPRRTAAAGIPYTTAVDSSSAMV